MNFQFTANDARRRASFFVWWVTAQTCRAVVLALRRARDTLRGLKSPTVLSLQCSWDVAPFGSKTHKRGVRRSPPTMYAKRHTVRRGNAQTCRGRHPRRPASPTHKTAAHKPVGTVVLALRRARDTLRGHKSSAVRPYHICGGFSDRPGGRSLQCSRVPCCSRNVALFALTKRLPCVKGGGLRSKTEGL